HNDDDRDDDRVHFSLLSRRLTQRHWRAIQVAVVTEWHAVPCLLRGPPVIEPFIVPPPPRPPRARPRHARADPYSGYGGVATPSGRGARSAPGTPSAGCDGGL